jgi:hypothetical protein
MELLQIEEPGERDDALEDTGIAIGLELTGTALRIAAAVGGNVEVLRNAAGEIDFLPALFGYDETGAAVAGMPGLADPTAIGLDALVRPEEPDARGASVADRVALLVATAGKRLVQLTGRPIGGAAVVVPLDSAAGLRLALLQAVEAGGVPVRRLVEVSVALAATLGLDADGAYLHLAPVAGGLALARFEIADGVARLVGGTTAQHADEVPALIAAEGTLRGLLAPGVAGADAFAEAAGVPLIAGGEVPECAVCGAALLAEAAA